MIKIENVIKKNKNTTILHDINMNIPKGKCVGLIGHNGSGKTMLLKAICGFTKIDSGTIKVKGKEIVFGKEYIKDSGVIIEHPPFINYISAWDNLKILANINNKVEDKDIENTLLKTGLFNDKDRKVKTFSLGMKQKLRIAQAIMEDPEILILDEPFNGLDRDSVANLQDILMEFKLSGTTIVLTSHDERHIEALCDEVFILEGGKSIEHKVLAHA
ncbi:ABC transporter ATP-binding protein [Exiguobacterium sp. SRB7LM]|uniref:ABC transporter ATP-binding protein n=1 Tax=Exiguobacterium sp. SRB7LM TaxID=2608401 RepID=UPI0018C3C901|nr:ATP-binding cassette domain-containing protein [Exiguobacterium sp. SRB7LM]MBG0917122.1 ATP-binding cassette domain-containing protein [Exiguobacterium sp. SRB7LM]